MGMPEEVNRVVADHVSRLLLCPTSTAIKNLERESITSGVHHVGDVMFDATLHARARARETSSILDQLKLDPGTYAVATVHRAGNTDDPAVLSRIVAWLLARAREHKVVFPVHPRTKEALARAKIATEGLITIPPVGFFDMTRLLDGAVAVYTDSGGLQKEAYFHGKPCVTLRSETEWVELIAHGWNRLWTESDYRPRKPVDDYGTGRASEAIVTKLAEFGTDPA
jgi:UDP-GlcNAc3NAcA epimerase